ncbi:MAG TPA: FadD3 family acyl-CoA ligase [Streptosporangiaceae bacterium]|nr:FadD3 family acyl-CoA ligase [Streptosporangiaceae bacterium]
MEPTTTIPAAVAQAARAFGDAPALAEPGGPRLSYRELHERVVTVARALIAEGVAPGDRVAIWSPNTHHWVLGALGALHAGATLVPVSTRFTGHEALDVISRSGARALIVAGPFLGTDRLAALRAAAGEDTGANRIPGGSRPGSLSLIVQVPIGTGAPGGGTAVAADGAIGWDELLDRAAAVPASVAAERAAAVSPGDVSDIMFTSGTTGRSKGAMTAHRQSLAVARAWAGCGCLTRTDRYLVVNPFFHSFGFKAGILACLVSGATLVPQLVYDAGQAMALVEAERITVFPGPPTIYQTILDRPERAAYDLSSLRLAVTGAAAVPVALVERMRRELSFTLVLTAYGLTEAVVATMCRPGDDPQTVARTSGRAAAGFEVRISVPDGRESAPGETGEILLRGPNLMLGYLDDQEATRAAIDADGWLHTGDVGHLNEGGYLTITDRLTDLYICGGFNVYPAEVEQVLARLDGVAESAVVGVPDARLGEVGRAYVVTRAGHALDAGQVLAHCRQRLAGYKVPRQVVFCDGLPRNPAGKVLKRRLREEAR